jgi:hypothetical protein
VRLNLIKYFIYDVYMDSNIKINQNIPHTYPVTRNMIFTSQPPQFRSMTKEVLCGGSDRKDDKCVLTAGGT